MKRVLVAVLSAVSEGEARSFDVEGTEVVLCRAGDQVYALSGTCTHEELPLDGGEVEGGVLTCPWHGAQYDVRTGSALALPAVRPLRAFDVEVENGRIYIIRPD